MNRNMNIVATSPRAIDAEIRANSMMDLGNLLGPDAVQYGPTNYAVPVAVTNGEGVTTTRWLKIDLTVALATATKTAPLFDPYTKQVAWLEETAAKAEKKAMEKAKNVAKAEKDAGKRAERAALKAEWEANPLPNLSQIAEDDMYGTERDADGMELYDPENPTDTDLTEINVDEQASA